MSEDEKPNPPKEPTTPIVKPIGPIETHGEDPSCETVVIPLKPTAKEPYK